MSKVRLSKYFWPASGITEADMALLHSVREATTPRVPIAHLVAQAVREQYGNVVLNVADHEPNQDQERKAA